MNDSSTVPEKCNHCGRVSSSLLRCADCKSAWYCNSTCQALAWNDPTSEEGGHKIVCRRLRKLAVAAAGNNATTSSSSQLAAGSITSASDALVELMQHTQTMDCNEAYKQMCLAQDEIRRLQSEIQQQQEMMPADLLDTTRIDEEERKQSSEINTDGGGCREGEDAPSDKITLNPKSSSTTPESAQNNNTKGTPGKCMRASGSWLDQGGNCSIEYLPNVKCYQITLTAVAENDSSILLPQPKDDLRFTMTPFDEVPFSTATTSYYEAKLYLRIQQDTSSPPSPASVVEEARNLELLLSVILPTAGNATKPTARMSIDANSISLRILLNHDDITTMPSDGCDLTDNLLGIEGSSFSSNTTDSTHLNHLRCRSCQIPIIDSDTIQSVLPLPSGYWDEISDYLTCYDGQATVDFTSSSTNAIPRTALEDDAILVLHRQDLAKDGVRAMDVRGYGEHSSAYLNGSMNGGSDGSAQAWRDKSAGKGERPNKALTCANCCSTLGFVSDHDADTYRLYKHLLDCGMPTGDKGGEKVESDVFSKYTCGSFLAREMVRYAESEAVFTFIVGISDENDWTRVHSSGACILLRILSWDSLMATMGDDALKGDDTIHFQKVVKVIFEVMPDRSELIAVNGDNDPMDWTWRGTDFCCPPPSSNMKSADDIVTALRTRASSIRIFFSKQEWYELKDALTCGSSYFSDSVKDAVLMTKLGLPNNDQEQTASLSYLPLVH